jgi:hypothetical protein
VTALVVLQPNYLPWLEYFDLLQKPTYSCTTTTCGRASISALRVSKWRWVDIECASSELHPFSVKRLTDIPLPLRRLADVCAVLGVDL